MSADLFYYQKLVQKFLRDQKQELLNPEDLVEYINIARREVAMRTQCVRVLTPISGSIVSASVVNPGSGYTAPSVSITPPDFPSAVAPYPLGNQASATVILSGGSIAAVPITYGGSGYFQPQGSITDAHGVSASISFSVQIVNALVPGQEVYPFSGIDLSANPGADSVFMVKSISILYSNYRYSLPVYAFSEYQARIRQYPYQYQYVPTFASQFGQGTSGSFYVYPLPSQVYQYELDCFCIPANLTDNQSVEIIPAPWTDAVPYFAAALCYQELQNLNAANYYHQQFDLRTMRFSSYARPGRMVNPYGRV